MNLFYTLQYLLRCKWQDYKVKRRKYVVPDVNQIDPVAHISDHGLVIYQAYTKPKS